MTTHNSPEVTVRPFLTFAFRSLVLTVAACMVLGCTCSEEATPATDTTQEEEIVARSVRKDKKNKRKKHRKNKKRRNKRNDQNKRRSPGALLIRSAIKKIELTDDQRAQFDKLRNESRKTHSSDLSASKKALFQKLVTDTVAGSIDPLSYDGLFQSIEKARQDQLDVQRKLLADLHALLSPEQRKALSDEARLRQGKYAMRAKKKAGMCAPGQECPENRKTKAQTSALERFKTTGLRLSDGLKLSPEQQTKIDELIKELSSKFEPPKTPEVAAEEEKSRFSTTFGAFENDTLDPGALLLEAQPGLNKWGEMKMQVEYLARLLVVLTPEQQQLVGEKLKQRFQRKSRPTKLQLHR
jgi:Spy/CpxP family protein refolding chaperone